MWLYAAVGNWFWNEWYNMPNDHKVAFLWSSKSFTLSQPANHVFIKINLLRNICTKFSHACCSLCRQAYIKALDRWNYQLVLKLLANLISRPTTRMLLEIGSLRSLSSCSQSSILRQHPRWRIVPDRVGSNNLIIDYCWLMCTDIEIWLIMLKFYTSACSISYSQIQK